MRAGALFQPVRSATSTPVTDCDYNAHKSNSTYFADLDLARLHLLGALGFIAAAGSGGARPALGGVSCNFRKPVAPLQRVHIYSRVLSWDTKWLYVASWIVRADGARLAQPSTWTLQPWRTRPEGKGAPDAKQPEVYAVSLARYVFKKGRVTVPPETVLTNAGLLPSADDAEAKAVTGTDGTVRPSAEAAANPLQTWTVAAVEQARLRGLEIAKGMTSLDSILDDLRPAEGPALGEY